MSRSNIPATRSAASRGRRHTAARAVRIVIDADDHPAWTAAALDAHSPENGRVTLHPSPGSSAPPALAQDILCALGKRLPPRGMDAPRHRASWADMVGPAWTAAASWINAYRTGHLIVLRAHTLTPARWEQLDTLRARTGIHLTLIWHRKPDTRLTEHAARLSTGYQKTDGFDAARDRLREKGPAHPGTRPHTTDGPDTHTRGSGHELIEQVQQIGHPLHAGLLAAQLLSHTDEAEQLAAVRLADLAPDATALALPRLPYRPTSTRHWHSVPTWAQPLLIAARAWHYLNGHHHPSRHLFQHTNLHHHNQLTDILTASGITPAINILTGDPAWPTPATPPR
ncbi:MULTISPECIES: hypothetical protein [unclassified Streptomyces]|uniref:hypothetical protein n=1 Tax=unclassified Streptomyces TaxID=2593676 RepID=UPI000F5BA74D|nr:hypothetical protein [Streptomyces sp. ADI95-17]WSG55596.1 hypothetical protein OHA38_40885 [Streptomyces sp. NBC_01732]WSW99011.1 hypothetical protein OG355_00030 [Streptomyces sp. NBC_00987]RPK53925.1 hypothetical protein EES42_43955 [Streptomyces sp. ADI95-17]WSG56462.1 hypothetical protein OHA38_43140 [Streptomyces sp. NBC_01732]WSX06734.1 hypothetical protein OG355_43760 [Streptomyces sp. NBC_00987]